MNHETLVKFWKIIVRNDLMRNMSGDFKSHSELSGMVDTIMDSTVFEPIDVHHCITTLDCEVMEAIVQRNGTIVGRVHWEADDGCGAK